MWGEQEMFGARSRAPGSAPNRTWTEPMSSQRPERNDGVGRRVLAALNGWWRRLRGADGRQKAALRLSGLKPIGLAGSVAAGEHLGRLARQRRMPEVLRRAGLTRKEPSMDGVGAALDLLCRYLEEDGFVATLREDGLAVESGFRGQTGGFRLVLFVRQEPAMIGVVVRIPEVAPEAKRPEMAEAIARANYGLAIGCFELDMSDGEIDFRAAIPGPGDRLTREQFRALVGSAMWTCDRYHRAFCRLIYGEDLSPAEVIAEVEMADLDRRKRRD